MSMDIPPMQREFTLEPNNSNSDDFTVRIRNLMPASINSFIRGDKKELAEKLDNAAIITFAGLLGANSLLFTLDSLKPQDSNQGTSLFSSPIVIGINVSLMAVMYAMRELSSFQFLKAESTDATILEKTELPTNDAKLSEGVYNAALQSGIMPNKFKDPITRDTIEEPVAFSDDPSLTIYDLETVKSLRDNRVTKNPMVGSLSLNFDKLVYLPEVKRQIQEINKLHIGNEI
ncbi:MAG TPA: hypothetical protein VGP47_00140 [Parachlamydiaceae bacterium]|nr:hypothetical protein [Parachlamydiaceae bacterium]